MRGKIRITVTPYITTTLGEYRELAPVSYMIDEVWLNENAQYPLNRNTMRYQSQPLHLSPSYGKIQFTVEMVDETQRPQPIAFNGIIELDSEHDKDREPKGPGNHEKDRNG